MGIDTCRSRPRRGHRQGISRRLGTPRRIGGPSSHDNSTIPPSSRTCACANPTTLSRLRLLERSPARTNLRGDRPVRDGRPLDLHRLARLRRDTRWPRAPRRARDACAHRGSSSAIDDMVLLRPALYRGRAHIDGVAERSRLPLLFARRGNFLRRVQPPPGSRAARWLPSSPSLGYFSDYVATDE